MLARISILTTLLAIAGFVHLLAKERAGLLFLVPLGRPVGDGDRRRMRRLRVLNAISVVIAAIVLFTTEVEAAWLAAVLVGALAPALALVVELVLATKDGPPPKIARSYVVDAAARPGLSVLVSPPLLLASLAILAAGLAAFLALYPSLPAEVPLHWDLKGEVDRTGSPRTLWVMLLYALFASTVLFGLAAATSLERWVLPLEGRERYAELAFEKRQRTVRMLEVLMVILNGTMMAIWVSMTAGAAWGIEVGSTVVVVIGPISSILVMVTLALRMPRLTEIGEELRAIAAGDALGTRFDGWKLGGLVYFAPEDPSVFVPKRSGLGQTVNLARPGAWIVLSSLVLVPLVILMILGSLA